MPKDEYNFITEAITRMLSRREHSQSEIRAKLAHKNVDPELVEAALGQFINAGLQSDERYCESRIRALAAKGSGERKIRADLALHGISTNLVERILSEQDIDFYALARSVKEKKFGLGVPQQFKDKAKQMRFLQTRGFEMSQIHYAMTGE